jgi:hypothetical protein
VVVSTVVTVVSVVRGAVVVVVVESVVVVLSLLLLQATSEPAITIIPRTFFIDIIYDCLIMTVYGKESIQLLFLS